MRAIVALAALVTVVAGGCGDGGSSGPRYEVRGVVEAGPTCPVEQPGQACPPRPVQGAVTATRSGRRVGTTTSDTNGRFVLQLPDGDYEITVDTGAALPRCAPVSLHVRGRPVDLKIECDTGIR